MPHDNVLSADNQQGRLHEWYVSGFADGEGSFHIALYKDVRMKTGWKVIPEFHVSQRVSSRSVLDSLVQFFGCGYVKANHPTNPRDVTYVYVVRDREDLMTRIIPFFQKFPLQTEKANDFRLFAQVVELMKKGEHRQEVGINSIIHLAYQMNGAGKYRRKNIMSVKPSETTREILRRDVGGKI